MNNGIGAVHVNHEILNYTKYGFVHNKYPTCIGSKQYITWSVLLGFSKSNFHLHTAQLTPAKDLSD